MLAADIQIKDKVKEAKLITDKASSQQQLIIIEVVLEMKSRTMHIGARPFVRFSIRIWLTAKPEPIRSCFFFKGTHVLVLNWYKACFEVWPYIIASNL